MNCKLCNKTHSNKTFCSHKCRNEWVRFNNITNNPIHNPRTLEKMRKSLTGKKQSEATKSKRSATLKNYYLKNPEAKDRLAKNVWDKYTSRIAGTGWRKVRLKALERDNYTCCKCGETNTKLLVVHHKNYKGKNMTSQKDMDNRLSNLETLCHKCHNAFHRHKAKDYHDRMAKIDN